MLPPQVINEFDCSWLEQVEVQFRQQIKVRVFVSNLGLIVMRIVLGSEIYRLKL